MGGTPPTDAHVQEHESVGTNEYEMLARNEIFEKVLQDDR
jgi:hypothetical protein